MTVGLVVGAMLGALVAGAVLGVRHRRREQATIAYLDEVAPPSAMELDRPGGDVYQRVRRVGGDLVESVARADRRMLLFQGALDRMAEGIVVCDSTGRVILTNEAGAILADARHQDALVAAAVTECLRSALAGIPDMRTVDLSGPPVRTLTVDAQPLGDLDGPIGAVATITDESRLRRLESVRSDFVANVSHELKTPIGGLALLAEALEDALAEVDVAPEQEQLAGRLLHEAHRVGRVVDDLLALGEIESEFEARREPVAVVDILERTRAAAAVLADGFDIEIETSVVDDGPVGPGRRGPAHVGASPTWWRTPSSTRAARPRWSSRWPAKGRSSVSPSRTVASASPVETSIGSSSASTGSIRPAARPPAGPGLGLAIVRNVIQSHGGEVELSSREGEGTTVIARCRCPAPTGRERRGDRVESPIAGAAVGTVSVRR